jgi:hypothetical protein
VIWLGADVTDYAVPCEACEDEARWPRELHPTLVEGTLRAEADVGFTTCFRGHRIRIRRISRLKVVAAR